MLGAIAHLYKKEGVLAEPAGAAAAAAFIASRSSPSAAHGGDCVVLLVTGANISEDVMDRAGVL